MIYVTGDTHRQIDYDHLASRAFPIGRMLTKKDYVIVAGDFGVLWTNEPDNTEKYLVDWYNNKPWTTLFVCGNHENFYRLLNLEQVPMFGSLVGKVSDSIFHLRRGEVYNIDGTSIFTFGGAESIDKGRRIFGISWWPEELPNATEYERGLAALDGVNNIVDLVITHDCPESIFQSMLIDNDVSYKINYGKSIRAYFELISKKVLFKKWYYGHYHVDTQIDNFYAVYRKVLNVKD